MAYSGAYGKREERKIERPVPVSRRISPDIGDIFKKIEAAGIDADDLLMALILFLLYRESGDKELLIMLGAMLLI